MNKKFDEQMTGKQLFVQYGRPCLPIRLEQKKITETTFNLLQEVLEKNLDPDVELIKVGLTDDYDAYLQYFADTNGLAGELLSYDSVADYWRHKHCHLNQPEEECKYDLWHGKIEKIIDNEKINLRVATSLIDVKNIYNLPIKVGDQVYEHKHCIIEIFND